MTFHEYIAQRRDRKFPPQIGSWPQLATYLRNRSACPEAIRAARIVWRAYERFGT